jgi:hypothetical protein
MAEEIVPAPALNMENVPSPLESDLDRLAGEVAKHKENPEMSGTSEQEMVKQAIRTMSALPPAPPTAPTAEDDSALPGYMASATPAAKMEVEELVRMAFKEGVAKATGAAQKSNPFILDAFHDALAGKLHEELKSRKLI